MKWTVLLMLACLQATAQADYVIFESGNFKGLKNSAGQEIVPPVYDDLGWTNGSRLPVDQLIGYQERDKWGLLSLEGKQVTPATYDKLEALLPGIFKVAIRGKLTNRYFYGLVNEKGKLLLNLDFFDIELTGAAVVVTTYENNVFREGAYSHTLTKVAEARYEKIDVRGNVLIARLPSGYLDILHANGKVLESKIEEATVLKDQIITRRAGKVGLITAAGEVIHAPIHKAVDANGAVQPFPRWTVQMGAQSFDIRCDSLQAVGADVWLLHFNDHNQLYSRTKTFTDEGYRLIQRRDGIAVLQSASSGEFSAVSGLGETLVTSPDSIYFDGHYFMVRAEKQWRVCHRSGKQVLDKTFESVQSLSGQYLGVKKFGYWAILDGINATVSDFRYDSIAAVTGFRAIVKYVSKWGVHHPEHGWLIAPDFDEISIARDHFVARKGRGYHLFDREGKLIFQTIDQIIPAKDFFMLRYGQKVSALGAHGRPVANTEYTSVSKWGDHFELQKGDTTELYSPSGRRILSAADQVQDVGGFSEGYFLIKKGDRYGFVDVNGKLRIANRYDSAQCFSEGLAPVMINRKWGFVDLAEKLVIQPYYSWVSPVQDGLITFRLNGKYGLLNASGTEILGATFDAIERTPHGNYILKHTNAMYGFADAKGVQRLSANFQLIEDMGAGTLRIMQNGVVGLFDYAGKSTIPLRYQEIRLGQEAIYLRQAD